MAATDPSAALPSEVDAALMRRLRSLVIRLLSGRALRTLNGLWRLQLDLLALQRDTQSAITKAKRRGPEGHQELLQLRGTLWHARRLGDAMAWLLFKGDRRRIYPLAENAKVPVPAQDHGSRGMLAAADDLSKRLGLPLLHDITDILRIGDATFFGPEGAAQTVEFKTSVGDQKKKGKGTLVTYHVSAIWPSGGPLPPHKGEGPEPPTRLTIASKRVETQLKRLSRAQAIIAIEPGSRATVDGRPTLILEAKGDHSPRHWPLLRRLIRRAKRTGSASGVADGATLYVVGYDPAGIKSGDAFAATVNEDLIASGILYPKPEVHKNSLWITGLPDTRGSGPYLYEPYFVYPIPRTWVIDILFGRLVIASLFNVGRLAEKLEDAGLQATLAGPKTYLKVMCDFEFEGGRWLAEMQQINDNIREMIMEAASLDYVVGIALALADGVADQIPQMMRDDRDAAADPTRRSKA